MSYLKFLILLVVLPFGLVPLFGQELDADALEKVRTEYFGSQALYKAHQLKEAGESKGAEPFFEKAVEELEKEKQWGGYAKAVKSLAENYDHLGNRRSGILTIEGALKKLEQVDTLSYQYQSSLIIQKAYFHFFDKDKELAMKTMQADVNKWDLIDPSLDDWAHIKSSEVLGRLLYYNGKHKEALPLAKKVIAKIEQLDYKNIYFSLDAMEFYSMILYNNGMQKEGIEFTKKAISIATQLLDENDFRIIKQYQKLGQVLFLIGEYAEGLKYNEKAIFIYENNEYVLDENQALFISILYSRSGLCYTILGDNEKAINAYEKVLAVIRDFELDDLFLEVSTLGEIGHIYERMGRFEEALSSIQSAEQLLISTYKNEPNSREYYHIFRNVNYHYARFYNRKKETQKSLSYNLKIIHEHSNPDAPWENQRIFSTASDQFFELGQIDSALYYNNKSIQSFSPRFEAIDYFDLPRLEELPPNSFLYYLLEQKIILLNHYLRTQKQGKDYDKLIEIITYFDRFHGANLLTTNDLRSGSYKELVTSSIPVYEVGLGLFNDEYINLRQDAVAEQVFYFAQKKKAQGLWLKTLSQDAVSHGNLPDSLLAKEKLLLKEITDMENEIFFARKKGDSEEVKKLEHTKLFDLKQSYNQLIQQLELDFPKYFESKYAFHVESSKEMQGLLKEDEALLEYVQVDSMLYIFCLSKDQPLIIEKIDWKTEDQKNVEVLVNKLQANSWTRTKHRTMVINAAFALYQKLIYPIEQRLNGKKRLVIIGEGLTHYIPFEMLVISNELKSYQDLDYLIHQFDISYHYSANLFAKSRRSKRNSNDGLLAFAPIYDETVDTKDTLANFNTALRAFNVDGSFTPLPESEREVKTISNLLKTNPDQKLNLLLGAKARKDNLLQNVNKDYRFIHIAGHSFADLENPKFSGIACWQKGELKDRVLFTSEIYNLNIKADLVILSSCESGFGSYDISEGILGLNRAFVYAGANNVIFSLWKVYDKVSADLMINFYEKVMEGKPYSTALREAKLTLINNPQTAAPHLWSSFLLIGR